jgi:putative ABC transport system ATP-binding protein
VLALEAWRVEPGARALILGPSGSGKTTLLHLLAGLINPTRGIVRVLGEDLGKLAARARDRFRGRRIGIVFQTLHLVPVLDVLGNLRLTAFLAGTSPAESELLTLLEQLEIAEKRHARSFDLSQGEAQRVAIARALVNRPDLLLADEPTSALDDANCARVLALLEGAAAAAGATLLIATHDGRLQDRLPIALRLDLRP